MPSADSVPFAEDYARVQRVLRGDPEAEEWFERNYGDQVMQTALCWCRPNCYRGNCRLRARRWSKLVNWVLGNDCDEFSDAYVFLLGELKGRILPGYQGRASLRVFLYPIFHRSARRDASRHGCSYYTLFASYVVWKRGKYTAPKWVKRLREFDQTVHRDSVWGRTPQQTAARLRRSVEDVEESRERIGEAARQEGPDTAWQWLLALEGEEVSLSAPAGDGEGVSIEQTLADESSRADAAALIAEGKRLLASALQRLSAAELVLLYMRCVRRLTGEQVAAELGLEMKTVYAREKHALEHFGRALDALGSGYEPLGISDLRDGLRGLSE
ncbi:MAG: hypothetical protein LAQ30_02465 [Acidobacteriia bacterium]|nr:hypothetical protein [Terriglobia bacterium]